MNDANKAVHALESNFSMLENGIIPESYLDTRVGWSVFDERLYRLRNQYTDKYGFSLVDLSWNRILVEKIIKDKPCLEVMAGTGIWSEALRTLGVDVICTDNLSWENRSHPGWKKHRTEIINMDAIDAIKTYGENVSFVLMSWPYMDNTAWKCLSTMREVNPNAQMIYIGENWGGCTADDEFFENMEEVENETIDEVNENYVSFQGIHDRIYLLK